MEQRPFVCRNCGSLCPIIVTLDGQRVIKVEGDYAAPLYRGYTCPKGRALGFDHHREDRIEQPMIRENGVLREASWDHVLDDLAAKLTAITADAGARGVGTFVGGGGFLDASGFFSLLNFLRVTQTPSVYSDMTIDSAAKYRVSPVQVVLRWHIDTGVIVIPKSTRPERIEQNIDIFGFSLTPDEVAILNNL